MTTQPARWRGRNLRAAGDSPNRSGGNGPLSPKIRGLTGREATGREPPLPESGCLTLAAQRH